MIPPENNQITFYETEDGKVRIEVRFEHENLWLSQKLMAELFECSTDNVSLHLQNIFKAGELDKNSVTEEYSVTAADGKKYRTNFYSLEAIIAGRADKGKPHMGLSSWRKAPTGKMLRSDIKIAKNYLQKII